MESARMPGFNLSITFNHSFPSTTPSEWISKHSGLKDNYADNILSFNMTGTRLSIIFDSKPNCFDVIQSLKWEGIHNRTTMNMQQNLISLAKPYYGRDPNYNNTSSNGTIKCLEVSKTGKKLRMIKVCPSGESELFDFRKIKQRLEKFGLVLLISREKDNGICTGYLYALMVFYDENAKFSGDQESISEVPYTTNCFEKWSKETTQELQKMFYEFVKKNYIDKC